MEATAKKTQKDVSVELLRIIAATMVVGVHVNQGFYYFDRLRPTGILISCFVADGVSIFWMIMGFFLFDSEYGKLARRTLKRVMIPMFVYMALMQFFGDFLSGSTTDIFAGFKYSTVVYTNLFTEGILKWRSVVSYTGHFWFLFCYLIVVLVFPALNGIVKLNKEKNRFHILFIILTVLLVINDIKMNQLIEFSHAPFQGALGASFIILFGYMIYRKKNLFENKILIGFGSLFVFILVNVLRTVLQFRITNAGGSDHILYWYTAISVLSVYSLIVFAFGIKKILSNKIVSLIIRHLGSLSMGVYFVHMIVYARLGNAGIMDKINAGLKDSASSILIFQLKKMGIVIACSVVVVELFMLVKMLLTKAYKKIRAK